MRQGIKRNKEFYFEETIHDLEYVSFSQAHMLEMTNVATNGRNMTAILTQNAKEAAAKKKRVAKL